MAGAVWPHLVHQGKLRVPHQRNALQHPNGADNEGKVGRDAEGVVKRDLCQVSGQLLEVDVLGAAALQRLVKHLVEDREQQAHRATVTARISRAKRPP
jgi:hypothetical protein